MKKLGKMLFEALSSLFKKPATSEYPFKKRPIHGSIAGMISFEQPKCIGCNMCVRNCPANAIKITKVADKVFSCELSLANCIFCSQCVLSCPKKALHTTDNFELAQIDKTKLTVKLEDLAPKTESVGPIKQQEIQTAINNAADASAVKKEDPKTVAAETLAIEKAAGEAKSFEQTNAHIVINNEEPKVFADTAVVAQKKETPSENNGSGVSIPKNEDINRDKQDEVKPVKPSKNKNSKKK